MVEREELTKENAKEFYITHRGVLFIPEEHFLIKNFDKATLLEWNVELTNISIKKYKKANKKDKKTFKSLIDHIINLLVILQTYVENKEIYKEEIELLKDLYKKYGYFMNYPLSINHKYGYHDLLNCYFYDEVIPSYIKLYTPKDVYFYYKERKFSGFIPNLFYLKYYDLLDDYLDNCFLEICDHFKEESKYINGKDIRYFSESKDLMKNSYCSVALRFLKNNNYKLPPKLSNYLKEKGIEL